jgi:hypothetical protein
MSDKKVKHYDAIIEMLGVNAEESLKAIDLTLQIASDEIQQGVDNGYPVDVQVKGARLLAKSFNKILG